MKFNCIIVVSQKFRYVCLFCDLDFLWVDYFVYILFGFSISHIDDECFLFDYFLTIDLIFIIHFWFRYFEIGLSQERNEKSAYPVVKVSTYYFGLAIKWEWSFEGEGLLHVINKFENQIFFIFNSREFFRCELYSEKLPLLPRFIELFLVDETINWFIILYLPNSPIEP